MLAKSHIKDILVEEGISHKFITREKRQKYKKGHRMNTSVVIGHFDDDVVAYLGWKENGVYHEAPFATKKDLMDLINDLFEVY